LALCLDEHLRRSAKGKSSNDISDAIDNGIHLFRYVRDKDRFESLYRLHLAKRLLNSRSSSEEIELTFVEKLKEVQGTNFTTNLEKMFIDMRTSRDLQSQFRLARHNGEVDVKFDVNVNVLRQNFWPSSTASSYSCVLPEPFADARSKFERFYATKHSGHVLKWAYHVGSADIRVRFRSRVHDINLPTVSMAVLMLFEYLGPDEFLTTSEIQERTQVPISELSRHLLSIAVAPNTRILKKVPMSKVVNSDDKFYFNENFESPMARVKVLVVNSSSKPDPDKDRSVTDKEVEQSRMHETDAAIVRVMK
jgi:cullin 3